MDGLVPGVTTLTSQPQLSHIQQTVQSLCSWKRFVKSSLRLTCLSTSSSLSVCKNFQMYKFFVTLLMQVKGKGYRFLGCYILVSVINMHYELMSFLID